MAPVNHDSEEAELRKEFGSLIERLLDLGRRQGHQAALSILDDARTKLGGTPRKSGEGNSSPDDRPRSTEKRRRAPVGQVQRIVEEILTHAPVAIGPQDIVDLARKRGADLNPSSVRMALQTLKKGNRVISTGRGRWQMAATKQTTEQPSMEDMLG